MPGNKNHQRDRNTRRRRVSGIVGQAKWEVTPGLPTSGQILGVLVKSLGITHPDLRDKTAQRYFSGRLKDRIMESRRDKIVSAIAETMSGCLFESASVENQVLSSPAGLYDLLQWHAVNWDRFRTFLQPRVLRVYPEHLGAVWQAFLRLAAIDLALRAAAHVHLAGASPDALEFLEWTSINRRGQYLNKKRAEAQLPLFAFAEAVGVSDNAAQAWLYQGARPTDDNLAGIARALASNTENDESNRLLRELRKLYWVSDLAEILGGFIGDEAVDEMLIHLRRYASLLCDIIDDKIDKPVRSDVLGSLAAVGAHSEFSGSLLTALVSHEPDIGWKEDLTAAASDWTRRVLAVNLQIHREEEDALIRDTEGRVLRDWDISSPEAYDHYRRFVELQLEGRIYEAISELEMAVKLDPLDPVNHFTLGSAKSTLGAKTGSPSLVQEGLDACWVAATLDQQWILPWAEIGLILLESGRPGQAVEHLRAVTPERQPLASRYYSALGAALREVGRYEDSLKAFESSLELNPEDPPVMAAAAITAALAGNKAKTNVYRRTARYMGASDNLDLLLELAQVFTDVMPIAGSSGGQELELADLNAAINRNPGDPALYLHRARIHFSREDDAHALSDLDEAVNLDPDNDGAYFIRGSVYAYLKDYRRVVSDMTEVLRIDPGSAKARYHRGLAYGEVDELYLAMEDLSEVIRLEPDNADAYRGRGDCYRYQGQYCQAIADFNQALKLDPEHAMSYRGRGAAYRMKKELDQAIADYDEAVRLDPEDSFALRFRADAYLAKEDYERAVADCDASLKISGPNEVAYFCMGNAHLFSGRFDQAVEAFTSAIECNPDSGRAFYGRALAREVSGDPDGATQDYSQAEKLDYDYSG